MNKTKRSNLFLAVSVIFGLKINVQTKIVRNLTSSLWCNIFGGILNQITLLKRINSFEPKLRGRTSSIVNLKHL